jgi:DNA-binding MarR family transcriptional regulator
VDNVGVLTPSQSMGATLGVLDSLGLLSRSPDPADGRRTVRGVNQHREEWLATALDSELSSAELETLREALPLLRRLGQP